MESLDPNQCVVFFGKEHLQSNWHDAPFTHQGLHYATMEHWMMSKKAALFGDHYIHDQILLPKNSYPGRAQQLGRQVRGFDQGVWEQWREFIVGKGRVLQAQQHAYIWDAFVAAQGKRHIEASPYDVIWGIGHGILAPAVYVPAQWLGLNLLGKVLDNVSTSIAQQPRPFT